MVVLIYEQPVKATPHTVNQQAPRGQLLTDLLLREVQAQQLTVTPLRVHVAVQFTPLHEEAAPPHPGLQKQAVAAVKVHTDQDLQNHQHIHHPNPQADPVQRVVTHLHHQVHQEVQVAAILQALRHVHQEVAVAVQVEAADLPEAQNNLVLQFKCT